MTVRVVVADDHGIVVEGMRAVQTAHDGFELVGSAGTEAEAVRAGVTDHADVLVCRSSPGSRRAGKRSRVPDQPSITHIFDKLQVSGRAEAIVRARSAGVGWVTGPLTR